MTAYGFDLDGTLTRPELAQLANDLYDAGHEVYVVTGGLANTGEWTQEAREAYLAQLGIRYTQILRVINPDFGAIGRLKGYACLHAKIAVIFDDAPVYLEGIAETAPGVVRLQVLPLCLIE